MYTVQVQQGRVEEKKRHNTVSCQRKKPNLFLFLSLRGAKIKGGAVPKFFSKIWDWEGLIFLFHLFAASRSWTDFLVVLA